MDRELLMSYGIDYDKGLKNCMGNLSFYKRILSMFLQDQCFNEAKAAFDAENRAELFNRMHELKGISGNAALASLYEASVPLVELLREGDMAQDDLSELFNAVETEYRRTCAGITSALEEP